MNVKSEKYWVDLLDQYKLGSISDADRFELEKRALDDPFLFDALEGFSIGINVSTPEKKENTKLLTLPRMAAAASLIFLVAMIFLLKSDNNPEVGNDQSIAMVLDTNLEKAQSEIEEEEPPIVENKNSNDDIIKHTAATVKKAEPTAKKRKQKNKEQSSNQKPKVVKESKPTLGSVSEDKITSSSSSPQTSQEQTSQAPAEIQQDEVSFASVESVEEEIVSQVEKIDANNRIVLDQENMESKEVAENDGNSFIPSKNKIAKKEEAPSIFYVVEPAIGKKDFDEFVKESIDNRGLRQDTPHEVTIEFNIDKDGALTNFLHIFNGCSECGGYAIYLLSSSGVWKTVPEGQAGRARYTLEF